MALFGESKDLALIETPWGRQVRLQEVDFEGLPILRARIREGSRFTDLELTAEKAIEIGERLAEWGRAHLPRQGEGR